MKLLPLLAAICAALSYLAPVLPAPVDAPVQVATGEWRVVHALMLGCRCSAKRAAYIRHNNAGAGEQIVWMDPGAPVKPFGLAGGPWLLVYAPDGRLAYSGGYGGAVDSHRAILAALKRGDAPHVQNAFSCRTLRA